jgi:hypothetical protein
MSDVRLTATNPADSSVVAVACNARGELMTVAPVIEKIPNDVEIEGDLTVTGTINGDNGESGLPAPGPEGSILAIENGAPAWVGKSDLCAPPPPLGDQLILGPGVPFSGQTTPACHTSKNNINNNVTDFNAWLKEQQCWSAQPSVSGNAQGYGVGDIGTPIYRCEMGKVAGMVLSIGAYTNLTKAAAMDSVSRFEWEIYGDAKLQVIKNSVQSSNDSTESRSFSTVFSALCTRDDWQLDFGLKATDSFAIMSSDGVYLHWWRLEDQSTYLMREHIRHQRRIEKAQIMRAQGEVITTTDIDL